MTDIVLATSNPHKVEEMNAIFASLCPAQIRFVALRDAAGDSRLTEPAEVGTTFEANATIKALSYAAQTGMPCLADDSGLEIDALGGRPGVISSHYCTQGQEVGMSREERDRANNAKVLAELSHVQDEHRRARFVCVMALAQPTVPSVVGGVSPLITEHSAAPLLHAQMKILVRGTFEGRIAREPHGLGGFGYDPLFLVAPDFAVSSAQLPPAEKNRLSHRGAAARLLIPQLAPFLLAP